MIADLSRITPGDVEALTADLTAHPERVRTTCVQHSAEYSDPPSDTAVLSALNTVFERFPEVRFRSFGSVRASAAYDLSYLAALPAIRRLTLDLGGDLAGLDVLAGMAQLTTFKGAFHKLTDFSFLAGMAGLEDLRLEREARGSVKPSIAAIARLPKLRSLMVIGYKNGVEAIAECGALTRLHLQSVTLKRWDILPPQQMDYVCFSHVKGPEGLPDSFGNVVDFHTVGMGQGPTLRLDAVLPAPLECDGLSVQVLNIDALNSFLGGDYLNGHDWACKAAALVAAPPNVSFDPEAGGVSISGPPDQIVAYRVALFAALKSLKREMRSHI